jgi:hypothetical protein
MKKKSFKHRNIFNQLTKINFILICFLIALFAYYFLPKSNKDQTLTLPKTDRKTINTLIDRTSREVIEKNSPFN